ncbi:F-box protein pof7 [Mollisia scopiformis]|uniref:F-box protein pof7 n=1 Tax=Mollisia scopiformis TaxID=149040 RepID=A0A194XWW9_MOLSC|nr:F-box protein pof7 [Mollisia scopiformis]KUJ24651.1 F-box protein pof7 [Mollisia scopiformis]
MEDTNPELEQFRQQWRAEVSARQNDTHKGLKSSKATRRPPPITSLSSSNVQLPAVNEEEDHAPQVFSGYDGSADREEHAESSKAVDQEPQSALDHYEKAVERENQGSLGDSLNLYRKAFRMDHQVDRKYRNKHFPPSSFVSKPINPNPSNAPVTVPNPAHHSLDGPPQSIKQLIAGFASLSIESAPPAIEGTPAPPCPLVDLPEEILVHVLKEVAILDVASFVRLAQVCKRLAYLVATEEQIWKRVCLGSEVGFGAMHYQWQREVLGGPLKEDIPDLGDGEDDAHEPLPKEAITEALIVSAYSSSWHTMFRLRPRIRFNGFYISTVNYIRPGQASASQVTWNSPVHIVTYYRYLRFFRDGTVISLLTTDEPADVVHHLTKELQELHRGGLAPHLPSITMQNALRGRWRLSHPDDNPDADLKDAEGDLFVETEGANAKYLYRMKLSLRSVGKGAKNNKLVWQGFWNYNMLTDDTGEFTLRNDKAFFWSRVKSYGNGA